MSSFAKTLITGTDAITLLQRLCCASMSFDVHGSPPSACASRVVYTGMLNDHSGGYEVSDFDHMTLIEPHRTAASLLVRLCCLCWQHAC